MHEINSVHCGDANDFLGKFKKSSVNMILTDPPYGIDYESKCIEYRGNHKKLKNDKFDDWSNNIESWMKSMRRVITPGGIVAMFCGGGGGKFLVMPRAALIAEKYFNVIQILVWKKYIGLGTNYRPMYESILILSTRKSKYNFYDKTHNLGNVLQYNQVIPSKHKDHPTRKPLKLLKKLLEIHSLPGHLVVDPFCGSGSTAIACIDMNRNFIVNDLDPKYYMIAQEKIHNRKSQLSLFGENNAQVQ